MTSKRNAQNDNARRWCLAALTALLVVQVLLPADATTPADGAGLPQVLFWLALTAAASATVVGQCLHRLRFEATDAAILALVALHTVSGLWAVAHGAARPAINVSWEWIGLACGYLLVRQLVDTQREARAMMAVMIGLAVALSAHAFYQVGYEMPEIRAAYERDPETHLRAALDLPYDARIAPQTRHQFEARLNSPEPTSTFALTNSLAGFLVPWWIVTLAMVAGASRTFPRVNRTAFAAGSCAATLAGALALTHSRSAWIAALLGGMLVVISDGRMTQARHRWLSFAGVLIAGCAVSIWWSVVPAGQASWRAAAESMKVRLEYWQATWSMVVDMRWLGCGPGNFGDSLTAYQLPSAYEQVGDPHNFLFEVWATSGPLAAIMLIAALVLFFVRMLQTSSPTATIDATPDASKAIDESDRFIVGGAAVGLVLSLLCAEIYHPLIASSVSVSLIAGIAIVAAVTVALLAPWVASGSVSTTSIAIAAAALLVHLLAAGGIGNHGVAGSLWLLIGLGLNIANPSGKSYAFPRPVAHAAVVIVLGLAVTCFVTAYRPVLTSRTALAASRSLEARGKHQRADAKRQEAVTADPIDALAQRRLTRRMYQQWLASLTTRDDPAEHTGWQQGFASAKEAWLAAVPRSSAAHRHVGDMWMQAYHTSGDPANLRDAIYAYEQAILRYPNSASLHAHRALALALDDRPDEAAHAAAIALRLDDRMLHADYKLEQQFQTSADANASATNLRAQMTKLAQSVRSERPERIDEHPRALAP